MNEILSLLPQAAVEQVGWALVHFLWQGAAITMLLAGAFFALRCRTPNARYLLACGALALMLAAPVATVLWRLPSAPKATQAETVAVVTPHATPVPSSVDEIPPVLERPAVNVAALVPEPAYTTSAQPPWIDRAQIFIWRNLRWFVLGWLAGVIALSTRLLLDFRRTSRVRRSGRAVSAALQQKANSLAVKLGLKRAAGLFESALVRVPIALGWFRPVVLMPAALIAQLPPAQLEAILAHELAHIRRHDYLVNLFQTLAETLLFYHPAVHWVSRRIRHERELCCDDLAVSVCGDSILYARALTAVAALPLARPRLAAAASGSSLLARVQRLVGIGENRDRISSKWLAGVVVLLLAGACVCASLALAQNKEDDSFVAPIPAPETQAYASVLKPYLDDGVQRLPTAEEMKTLGLSWPTISSAKNAAVYLLQASVFTHRDSPAGGASSGEPYNGDQAAFEVWIRDNADRFTVLQEALELPDCQFPPLIDTSTGRLAPNSCGCLAPLRNLARTVSDAGFLEELKGDPAGAAGWYLMDIRLGKQMCQKPVSMVQLLVGIAVKSIGTDRLHRLIANSSMPDATLGEIIKCAKASELSPDELKAGAAGEEKLLPVRGAVSDHQRQALRDFTATLDTPLRVILADPKVHEKMKDAPAFPVIGSSLIGTRATLVKTDFRLRALQVRAAISLYQRAHNRLPEKLEDLCPEYLPAVPFDPFTGKPLRYARQGTEWSVWSLGEDLKDDNGREDSPGLGPDYVCRSSVPSSLAQRTQGLELSEPELLKASQAQDLLGVTPLHQAANRGDVVAVMKLMGQGEDVNVRGRLQQTPLHMAATAEVARALLNLGAEVDARDVTDSTPLQWAIRAGRADVVGALMEHKANWQHVATKRNAFGTPLQLAVTCGRDEVTLMMVKKGIHPNDLLSAAMGNLQAVDKDTIGKLIAAGADALGGRPGAINNNLAKALSAGRMDIVELIIAKGAPYDICVAAALDRIEDVQRFLAKDPASANASGPNQYTPLHWAATNRNPAMLDLLLANGADVNGAAYGSRPPLFVAVFGMYRDVKRSANAAPPARATMYQVVAKLLNKGARVNELDDTDATPLMYAAKFGAPGEVITLLLKHGADPKLKNKDGATALDLAKKAQNIEAIDALGGR